MTVYRITDELVFPPVEEAEDSGLLGVGGDLRAERLLLAYTSGIFPWYEEGLPVLWYSPDPRSVLEPSALCVSRSLAKTLRQRRYRVTMDRAFEQVIRACAATERPGQRGTWITEDMIVAYCDLHERGYAHSVESWDGERLAGGLYGLSLGTAFFGESMFARAADASKVAFVHLVRQVQAWDFPMVDCQIENPHLIRLGACPWTRERYVEQLAVCLRAETRRGVWRFDDAFDVTADPGGGPQR